jgi:hypothetical protein
MNVFEDLLGELKDENLLENTVLDAVPPPATNGSAKEALDEAVTFEISSPLDEIPGPVDDAAKSGPADERETFRKRAIDEVASLQMVEHVISGIEREHLKLRHAPFDDLAVKKALHQFVQVGAEYGTDEWFEAEVALLREIEAWTTMLAGRDKKVSVANLRRYCENSKPALSSQALLSLGRFYRNSPFSEAVRGKFEFIVTRLFARDAGDNLRRLIVGRRDIAGHIKTLYDNWQSLAFVSPGERQADIDDLVGKFDGLASAAESAGTYDELLQLDLFERLRLLKEDLNELFYVPEVAAAAIDCNTRVGNRYVQLVHLERDNSDAETVAAKYGYTYDQLVSQAAGKTLVLMDLLKANADDPDFEPRTNIPVQATASAKRAARVWEERSARSTFFGINKWILVIGFAAVAAALALYIWAEKYTDEQSTVAVAKDVDLGDSDLKQHLRTVRSSKGTLYGVALPAFDALTEEQQKEVLQKALAFAETRGIHRVNLLNNKGRTIGFASKDRLEILRP